jgi:nucleotide-binding universal stress UspA family protein
MASAERAFDFLTVLQKNHGAKKHYDRQRTFGSGGSPVVRRIAAQKADLAGLKNDDFQVVMGARNALGLSRMFLGAPTSWG